MTTKDELQQRLWVIAQLRAAASNASNFSSPLEADQLRFSSQSEIDVKKMIEDATQTLETQDFLSNPEQLAMAEQNFQRFISAMLEVAVVRNLNELNEDTFLVAKSQLCPLFPFC